MTKDDEKLNEEEKSYINLEHQKIVEWVENVKFPKKLFGGIDEKKMWENLQELQSLYEKSLIAERARYDALLKEQRKK